MVPVRTEVSHGCRICASVCGSLTHRLCARASQGRDGNANSMAGKEKTLLASSPAAAVQDGLLSLGVVSTSATLLGSVGATDQSPSSRLPSSPSGEHLSPGAPPRPPTPPMGRTIAAVAAALAAPGAATTLPTQLPDYADGQSAGAASSSEEAVSSADVKGTTLKTALGIVRLDEDAELCAKRQRTEDGAR